MAPTACARSLTTRLAPWRRNCFACPVRSTPTMHPKRLRGRFDASHGILEDGGRGWVDLQLARSSEVGIGGWLSGEVHLFWDEAIDNHIEQSGNSGR